MPRNPETPPENVPTQAGTKEQMPVSPELIAERVKILDDSRAKRATFMLELAKNKEQKSVPPPDVEEFELT